MSNATLRRIRRRKSDKLTWKYGTYRAVFADCVADEHDSCLRACSDISQTGGACCVCTCHCHTDKDPTT